MWHSIAYESPLTIAEVIQDISVNKYFLPAIQREYVWGTSQIERLQNMEIFFFILVLII